MDSDINTPEMVAEREAECARMRASAASVIDDLVDEFNHGVRELSELRRTILRLSERYDRCVAIPELPRDPAVSWESARLAPAQLAAAQASHAREYAELDAIENAILLDAAAATDDVLTNARLEC
jgi:hypothetical protein